MTHISPLLPAFYGAWKITLSSKQPLPFCIPDSAPPLLFATWVGKYILLKAQKPGTHQESTLVKLRAQISQSKAKKEMQPIAIMHKSPLGRPGRHCLGLCASHENEVTESGKDPLL